jgi:hypothetical protein
MTIATLSILPNAIVRLEFVFQISWLGSNIALLTLWSTLVLVIVGIDAYRARRLHPAFAWSAMLAIGALYTAWLGSVTPAWDRFWMKLLA